MRDDTSPSILVVDDEPANVRLMEALLARAGYANVTGTTDSGQALRLCQETQPDLVLLDLHMPPPDGFAILAELRGPRGQGREDAGVSEYLPVVVLTADVSVSTRQRALALGATDFLTKPFDATEVVLRLRNLLETRALHLELQRRNTLLREEVRARTEELDRICLEVMRRMAEVTVSTRVREDLLRAASHELRTPLTVIRGRVDIVQGRLERGLADQAWLRDQMAPLRAAIARMVSAVEEISDAAQLQMGQGLLLRRDTVDLAAVVERVAAELRAASASWRAAELRVDTTPPAPSTSAPALVEGDLPRLERVVYSLLATALTYSPPDAPIRITIDSGDTSGTEVSIAIGAGGGALPPDAASRIITDFYRGLTAVGPRGTGLGLAGCALIAEQHGGRLAVEAGADGIALTLRLPRADAVGAGTGGAP